MNNVKGIPYVAARFDQDGKTLNESEVTAGVPKETTDLIVVSHGWNNSPADAEELYTKLFGNFADVTKDDADIKARKVAIVGVVWPAKKFTELMSEIDTAAVQAGGAASVGAGGGSAAERAAAEAAIREALRKAAPLFDEKPEAKAKLLALEELAPRLADEDPDAEADLVRGIRELLDPSEASSEDATDFLFRGQANDVFDAAREADDPPLPGKTAEGGATFSSAASTAGDAEVSDQIGHAAGLGTFLSDKLRDVVNGVTKLLNKTTYYEMKQRAGAVGRNGVGPLIDGLAERPEIRRVHLVGHSFGGRLVSAAALGSKTKKLHSLSLLQAAFSHNGFSRKKKGFFRQVVDQRRVAGPILVTHTKNDTAVGWAYPRASWLARDSATAVGDRDDPFGAIGSNGAIDMEDGEVAEKVADLLDVRGVYAWEPGKFHNLESSKFIVDPKGGDAHGFVFVPQVAWAISRAVLAGPVAG